MSQTKIKNIMQNSNKLFGPKYQTLPGINNIMEDNILTNIKDLDSKPV